jgi:hypothetical protein
MYAGSSAHDEQDTASSAGAAGSACVADEVSSMPPPAAASRPAARKHNSAGQLKQQASEYRADNRNNALAASKSVGNVTAAEPAGRIKRGGFGVRTGSLVLLATKTTAASVGFIKPTQFTDTNLGTIADMLSAVLKVVLAVVLPLQDGGGVTKDGGLPPAPILSVAGERELVSELERIIDTLNKGTAVDWEKRSAILQHWPAAAVDTVSLHSCWLAAGVADVGSPLAKVV